LKTFGEFVQEELAHKDERIFSWISTNADELKDFLSSAFICEVLFSSKYKGMLISPSSEAIVLSLDLQNEFADLFGREFLDIFPFKYRVQENGEDFIVISPFEESAN